MRQLSCHPGHLSVTGFLSPCLTTKTSSSSSVLIISISLDNFLFTFVSDKALILAAAVQVKLFHQNFTVVH